MEDEAVTKGRAAEDAGTKRPWEGEDPPSTSEPRKVARANRAGKQPQRTLEGGYSSSEDSALAGRSDEDEAPRDVQLQRALSSEYQSAWQAVGDEGGTAGEELDDAGLARARGAKARKLLLVYELEYWGLMGELHTKHARFCERSGGADGFKKQPVDGASQAGAEAPRCAAKLCKLRPLELSTYCLGHITADKNQCLYP